MDVGFCWRMGTMPEACLGKVDFPWIYETKPQP